MKFEESDYIDLTNTPKVFVYFLIDDNNEVVYVGQTKKGLARVETHYNDKVFNKVYAILCDEDNLDYIENVNILKYTPKYNKVPNTKECISLGAVVKIVNKQFKRRLSKKRVLHMLEVLDATMYECKQCVYVSYEDFYKLLNTIYQVTNGDLIYGDLDKLFYLR